VAVLDDEDDVQDIDLTDSDDDATWTPFKEKNAAGAGGASTGGKILSDDDDDEDDEDVSSVSAEDFPELYGML
jgi:hypothetical protein